MAWLRRLSPGITKRSRAGYGSVVFPFGNGRQQRAVDDRLKTGLCAGDELRSDLPGFGMNTELGQPDAARLPNTEDEFLFQQLGNLIFCDARSCGDHLKVAQAITDVCPRHGNSVFYLL
jgi:hypothetical protein